MNKVIVAVAQTFALNDKELSYLKAEEMIKEAHKKGAKFILFPELMNYAGSLAPDTCESIMDGETVIRMGNFAKKYDMWINLGSIREKNPSDIDKPFNTSVILSPSGKVVASYRKIHLFDLSVGGESYRESDTTTKGNEIVVADTDICKIGLSICYDLRFPEMYRIMAEKGAKIICVPALFNATTGKAHFETLVKSIAIVNHCYVLASDHVGIKPDDNMAIWGNSMIVSPWGDILSLASRYDEELLTAEIDLDLCEKLKNDLGSITNRRLDVYSCHSLTDDRV